MADPVSIIGLVTGIIGFVGTVRDGIDIVLRDVNRYKRVGKQLIPLCQEIEFCQDRIASWSALWRINSNGTEDALRGHWGVIGYGRVKELLTSVYKSMQDVKANFEKTYMPSCYPHESYEATSGGMRSTVQQSALDKRLQRHKARYKEYLDKLPVMKRLASVFRGPLFREELDMLSSNISLLERRALEFYKRNWILDTDDKAREHVRERSRKHFILDLADPCSRSLLALLDIVADAAFDLADIQFNQMQKQFMESYQYSQDYGTKGDDNDSKEDFGMKYRLKIDSQESGLLVVSISGTETIEYTHQDCFPDLQPAIIAAITSPVAKVYLKHEETNEIFAAAVAPYQGNESRPLRQLLLSGSKITLVRSLHSEFSLPARLKLAYELAEAALLFMKTNVFAELCSCRVHQPYTEEFENDFTPWFRLKGAKHLATRASLQSQDQQWCEEWFIGMPIRRIGICLIEIALGAPIASASYDGDTDQVVIRHNAEEFDAFEVPMESGVGAIARLIELIAGTEYSLAVNYCLKQSVETEDISTTHLSRFYDMVVAPLFYHYQRQMKAYPYLDIRSLAI